MPSQKRTANITWSGGLIDGSGTIASTTSGAIKNLPVSWKSRTEDPGGATSPEELIAAANAACFAMALSFGLANDGHAPELLEVSATCTLSLDGGPKISSSLKEVIRRMCGKDPKQRVVLMNPEVLRVEGNQNGEEGCLSFPGIFTPVERSLRAIVRAQDLKGEWFELDGMELTARCMLHETDHCDGIVFLDKMSTIKREIVKRKIKKLQKAGKWD